MPRPVREHGCCGELAWRVDLPAPRAFDAVAQRLLRQGYQGRCLSAVLTVLRHREGHEIVLVPGTGRVQLRVYRLTPPEARAAAAERLFRDLVAAL